MRSSSPSLTSATHKKPTHKNSDYVMEKTETPKSLFGSLLIAAAVLAVEAPRHGEAVKKVFRVHMVRLFVRTVTGSPSPKSSCSSAVSRTGDSRDENLICQRHVSRRLQRVVGTRCWPKLHKVNNIARTSSHGALHPCGRLLWHGLVLRRPGGRAALAFWRQGTHHSLKTTGTIWASRSCFTGI